MDWITDTPVIPWCMFTSRVPVTPRWLDGYDLRVECQPLLDGYELSASYSLMFMAIDYYRRVHWWFCRGHHLWTPYFCIFMCMPLMFILIFVYTNKILGKVVWALRAARTAQWHMKSCPHSTVAHEQSLWRRWSRRIMQGGIRRTDHVLSIAADERPFVYTWLLKKIFWNRLILILF